jgi:hypothetical protein
VTAGKGLKKRALRENATPMLKTKGLELHVVARHAHDAWEAGGPTQSPDADVLYRQWNGLSTVNEAALDG